MSTNEYPQSMFLSRNKKNNLYPCKPQFYYIVPITTTADDILKYFFIIFQRKQVLVFHMNCLQTIHMKCQDLFSLKNLRNKNNCRLLQILLGALRVKGVKIT